MWRVEFQAWCSRWFVVSPSGRVYPQVFVCEATAQELADALNQRAERGERWEG